MDLCPRGSGLPLEPGHMWLQPTQPAIVRLRSRREKSSRQHPSRPGWYAPACFPDPERLEVARIAAEQLISPIAGEADRHMLAGEARHEEGGYLRGICKRLVEHLRQTRNDVERLRGSDIQLRVICAEMLSDSSRMARLVVALLSEANRERSHRSRALRLHMRHDHGRIDTAGEERPHRN